MVPKTLDHDAIGDIYKLIELKKGDVGRLSHIRDMLQKDRPLYGSDKRYLDELRRKYLTSDTHIQKEPSVSEFVRSEPETIKNTSYDKERTSNNDRVLNESESSEIDLKDVQIRSHGAESRRDDYPRSRENVIIVNQPRQSSAAWYLLPIFLSIVGGVISYLCLRKQDPRRARNTIILGAILFVIPIALLFGILGYVFEDTSVSSTNLTPAQIKQGAIMVPYDSLMNNNNAYEGEIIQYEGRIVQVVNNFGAYAIRVEVPGSELLESDVIWSNFKPQTGEEESWIKNLERKHDPFGQDPENVKVWGISKGLKEYTTLIGTTLTVPEVDVHIIERVN